jgi:hypothetical protein
VPDDVRAREARERDAAHTGEDAIGLDEPALLASREIDLRNIAGDDGLRREADPRQEHLHLFRRRVLRLVENDERVVERAAAHVGKRGDLDRAASSAPSSPNPSGRTRRQRGEGRDRPSARDRRAGIETLARLDCGTHQHQALYRVTRSSASTAHATTR